MSTLNVNIPATFEETVTAPHITGLETPTQPTDAANKQYVDDALAGGGGDYLPLAGGTMEDNAKINFGTQLVIQKGYIDLTDGQESTISIIQNGIKVGNKSLGYCTLGGNGLICGNNQFSGNYARVVNTPTVATDIANKQYVDNMQNVYQFSGQTIDGNYTITFILLYPRFSDYNDSSPSRFLGGALMGRVDRTTSGGGSAIKYTISNIFTDAGFYLRGTPVSGMPTRTQNFSFIDSNGNENGNLYFRYEGESPNTNLYVRITHPTAPASCFFNFTLPLGLEIGYNQ